MIGTNNLNNMKTSRFFIILIISLTIYTIPKIFFDDAMLYLSGGIIGGTISEAFKGSSENIKTFLVFLIWSILLISLSILFIRLKLKPIKYFVLLLVVFSLYIVDNLLAYIPVFDIIDLQKAILTNKLLAAFSIVFKSLVLAAIVHYGLNSKK